MLKQRLLTALVLILLMVWGVLKLSTDALSFILALFVVPGGWEWGRLIGLTSLAAKIFYTILVVGLLALSRLASIDIAGTELAIFSLAALWWLCGTIWVFRYRGETGLAPKDTLIGVFAGILVLVPTWLALLHIHGFSADGPYMLLFVMVLIWAADSGAYFAGRKLGKHKLAPMVSPGKTIEGVVGGLLAAGIFSLLGALYFNLHVLGVLGFVLLCLIVVLFSIIGDLFESLFKRRVGVKDSGQLLPGHGGVLDRIDSLTAAAPIFALGLTMFENVK